MKSLKFTRYSEWWEYKLIPLATIGYATLALYNFPLEKAALHLVLILASIVCGAIYVSVINDMTDIEEDAKAGKRNNMSGLTSQTRLFILFCCLFAGVIFSYGLFYPDWWSLGCYILAYIAFSLYSIPPFRLKKRGFLGVVCDASGAHLLPALIVSFSLIYYFNGDMDLNWLLLIGSWAFLYGLRGILWHQFNDQENDIKSGTNTFAAQIRPENFKKQEICIFILELIFIILITVKLSNLWVFLALPLYFSLVAIRKVSFKHQISLIITPRTTPYQLLMNDFYLVFLPISLLLSLTFTQKYGWVMLICHTLLFPKKIFTTLKDYYIFIKNYV